MAISRPKCFYLSPKAIECITWFALDRECLVERNGRKEPNLSAALELLAEEIRPDLEPHRRLYDEMLTIDNMPADRFDGLMPWEIAHEQWVEYGEYCHDLER